MSRSPVLIAPALLAVLALSAPTPAAAFKTTPAATPERVGECQGLIRTFSQYSETYGTDIGPQWRQALVNLDTVWKGYDVEKQQRANAARAAFRETMPPLIEREGQHGAAQIVAQKMSRCAELFYAE